MTGRIYKGRLPLGLVKAILVSAPLLVACQSDGEPAGNTTPVSYLSTKDDCITRGKTAPPTAADLATGALEVLAGQCKQVAAAVEDSIPAKAAAFYNAAQLYSELGERRAGASDTAGALSAYADAKAQVSQSIDILPDSASSLASSDTDDGVKNTRYKVGRFMTLATADVQRGLLEPSTTTARGYLKSGLSLLEADRSGLLVSAEADGNPLISRAYDTLLVRSALAQSRLVEIEGNSSGVKIASAMDDLAKASKRARSAGVTSTAALADASLAKIAKTHASANMKSSTTYTQAIDILDAGLKKLPSGLADERAGLQLMLGDALYKRAGLSTDAARKAADYCAAADAFLASQSAGTPDPKAFEGRGLSLAKLSKPGQQIACSPQQTSVGQLADAAISDFNRIWKKGAGSLSGDARTEFASLLIAKGDRATADQVLAGGGTTSRPSNLENYLRLADGVTGPQKETYLDQAKSADPNSPAPYVRLGKYYMSSDPVKAETEFMGAFTRAQRDPQKFQADYAEAAYLRSKNDLGRGMKSAAASHAAKAVELDYGKTEYRMQACRAALMKGDKELGSAAQGYCSSSPTTADGALLNAFMEFRKAQIARKKNPNLITAFRTTEAAYGTALTTLNGITPRPTEFTWPGAGKSYKYAEVIEYGQLLARACGTPRGEPVQAPRAAIQHVRDLLKAYGVEGCATF